MKVNEQGQIVFEDEADLKTYSVQVVNDTIKAAELNKPTAPTIITVPVGPGKDIKTADTIVKWFKALGRHDINTMEQITAESYSGKAAGGLSEGTTTAGGYLVPVQFSDTLIYALENYGSARRHSTVVPMTGLTLNLNSLTGKVTAYFIGEGNTITPSVVTVGRPVLTAKKIAGITMWTTELFEDNAVNIVDNLVKLYTEAFAYQEDNEFYNGTGSNFTGILRVTGTTDTTTASATVSSKGDLTYQNFLDCAMSLSPGKLAGGPVYWHMHRTIFALARGLMDDNGRPITTDPLGTQPASLLGYPIEFNEALPAASAITTGLRFAVFGNTKPWVYFGDRRQIRSKILTEATVGSDNLAYQDEEALQVTERVALVVAIPANIACMITA